MSRTRQSQSGLAIAGASKSRGAADLSSRIEALRERLRALLGDEKLLPVNFSASLDEPEAAPDETDIFETASPEKPALRTPNSAIRIWGLIGAPGVSRATRDGQFTYVNRRPVENRGLNYALIEGYHTSLMKGRYPVCCLFLELNPAAVDVNIHPAKREVKFHREFEIRKFTAQAVREALLAFHSEPARTNPAEDSGPSLNSRKSSRRSSARQRAGNLRASPAAVSRKN